MEKALHRGAEDLQKGGRAIFLIACYRRVKGVDKASFGRLGRRLTDRPDDPGNWCRESALGPDDPGNRAPQLVSDALMANAQSKVPVTDPHSTSSTYQSLARPAHRRIVSMVAVHMWHDFTVLMRPSANMLEKWTSQNWCSSTCSHACVCSPRTLSMASLKFLTTLASLRCRPGTNRRAPPRP